MMQNYILYVAYSNSKYINQCRFSLLKYLSVYNLNPPATTTVVVYTDHPELFEVFIPFFSRFEIISIDGKEADGLPIKKGAMHPIKTAMITHFFTKRTGNVLFFDTDTYITEPIENLWPLIANHQIIMYRPEGTLSAQTNLIYKKWDSLLQANTVAYGEKVFQYTPDFKIWNASIIGIHSSKATVMEDALLLTDQLYQFLPEKGAEKVALSHCLNATATIKDAAQKAVHYHNLKELDTLLEIFFQKNEEESIPNLVKFSHHINPKLIQEEKEQYQQLPFYKKWWLTLIGKNWNIRNYQHKF